MRGTSIGKLEDVASAPIKQKTHIYPSVTFSSLKLKTKRAAPVSRAAANVPPGGRRSRRLRADAGSPLQGSVE